MASEAAESDICNPQGVITLIIAPDGRVVAHAADFNQSGYGGFTPAEAQSIRAHDKMTRALLRETCATYIASSVSSYAADLILREVCENQRFKVHKIYIGYDDEDDN